ncbi:MAG: APA family basic amino acid/polyamine antiporter, partial [Brevundimonas sp.]
ANAGTLAAFCSVGVCLIVLRIREPGRKRVFKAPLWPVVGAVSVIGCLVFFLSLKPVTQIGFVVWNVVGVAIYLLWSSRNSRLAKGEETAA